jgi:hypothetical protein
MEMWDAFTAWAWARHHNPLSWYVRPLLLIPFCVFAYRRSVLGIVLTLVAIVTSMFWFPPPEVASKGIAQALAIERAYLSGPWSWWKALAALLVPLTLVALAAAFWKRSIVMGMTVLILIALLKVGWSAALMPSDGFLALLVPAIAGLLVCNVALWTFGRRASPAHQNELPPPAK